MKIALFLLSTCYFLLATDCCLAARILRKACILPPVLPKGVSGDLPQALGKAGSGSCRKFRILSVPLAPKCDLPLLSGWNKLPQESIVKMILVTCAIIKKKGKILLARRSANQKLAGKWEFPGGKIEDGESPEECLKRELGEEFGIWVEVGRFITSNKHTYDHISIELLAFHTKHISGKFTLADHDKIEWVNPTELMNYDLAEADVPIARILHNNAT